MNPGRFAPITCSLRVDSPHLIAIIYYYRWSLFRQFFLVIIYLLVCKKNNNSFILVYFKYLFISCTYKKKKNSFILVYFCQRSQAKLFLQNLQKTTQEQ